jgi:hypothetical protein
VTRESGRARPEQWLEKALTFDPTVGSRLNFYRSLRMLFSLVLLWNRYSVTGMSGQARPE